MLGFREFTNSHYSQVTPLEQQFSTLVSQLEQLRDAIPVDRATTAVTLEKHSPGNGSTYTRLRVPKGKALANGKRTMSLKPEDVQEWERKIHARNQQAKLAQCLTLIEQAAEIATSITWEFEEETQLVNDAEGFTIDQSQSVAPGAVVSQPQLTLKYVFKDAKGASPMNRKVHAIAEPEPTSGRWYGRALCGEKPRAGSWGWLTCDRSELSCPKCSVKLKALAAS